MTGKKKPGQPQPTVLDRRERLEGEADGHLGSAAHWIVEAIRAYNGLHEADHLHRGPLAAAISRAYTARADAINYRYRQEETP